jgi:uncharacterized protein YcbK (DUF882 family)
VAPSSGLAGPAGPGDEPAPAAAASHPSSAAPAPRSSPRVRRAEQPRRRPAKARSHRRTRPRRTAAYAKALGRWRDPPPVAEVRWEGGLRDVTFYSVNWRERVTVRPFRADGALDPEALAAIRQILRDRRTGESGPVDERLVRLLYRVVDRFDAPQITVISGFRTPRPGRSGHHSKGEAIDFLVPGVPDREVAEFARTLGRCGVGLYPTSGFVHLDVRDRSYCWTDTSGPGQRGRIRQIAADSARAADRGWESADDAPPRRARPDGVQVMRSAPSRTPPAPAPTGADADADVAEDHE